MADPERNKTVQDLFQRALDLANDERSGFLDENCPDASIRSEVDSLLSAFAEADEFLAEPPISTPGEQAGDEIGRYRLLEQIGEGGFGVVWMAEQQEPVRRRVAVKIIKLGMDTRQVIARFEAERQALALMDHPNIAKVLDGGATESGRPYFVMELVRGVSVTEYCDKANLDTQARLELFQRICLAVQHAHQKGIIHRDLKPSNVLVTLHDGEPVPKVIDFGVAKATSQELTQRTLFTQFRQMIGTPEYMAPEQAEMSGLDIDTRADVYSLGVILYELLTGTKPLDATSLLQDGYEEMMRHVREVDPPKPSTRISTLGERLPTVAQSRRIEPGRLGRIVRGELDWIAMRALEKQRQRRYPTARALAEDIRRYIEDEPIEAGPPTASYRASKFLRRNRTAVATVAMVFVALIAGVIGTSLALQRAWASEEVANNARQEAQRSEQAKSKALQEAKHAEGEAKAALAQARSSEQTANEALAAAVSQKAEAERQATRATLSVDFLTTMLASSDPNESRRPDMTVRDLLQEASTDVKLLQADPEVSATIRSVIGASYRTLGQLDKAEQHLNKALEQRQQVLGPDHALVAESLSRLAWLQHDRSDYAGAIERMNLAIEITDKEFGIDHASNAARYTALADFTRQLGKLPEALALCDRAIALMHKHKVTGTGLVMSLQSRGNILEAIGKYPEAEAQLREVVEKLREQYGPRHLRVGHAIAARAEVLLTLNKLDDAEAAHLEALKIRRDFLPARHAQVASSLNSLATISEARGNYDAAEARYRESLAADPEVDIKPVITRANLAMTLMRLKKWAEAEAEYDAALVGLEKFLRPDHPTTAMVLQNKARLMELTKRLPEAEAILRQVMAMRGRTLAKEHPQQGVVRSMLGMVLFARGKHEEANTLMTDAVRIMRGAFQQPHFFLALTIANHGLIQNARKQLPEAEKLLVEAADIYEKAEGRNYEWAEVRASIAALMVDTDRTSNAVPIAREALDLLVKKRPDSPQRWWAAGVLGEALQQAQPEHARKLLTDAAENFSSQRPQLQYRRVRILTQLVALLERQGATEAATTWRKTLTEAKQ